MLLSIVVILGDAEVNDLLQIIHLHHFEIDLGFIFMHTNDCKNVVQQNEDKVMTKNGFQERTS